MTEPTTPGLSEARVSLIYAAAAHGIECHQQDHTDSLFKLEQAIQQLVLDRNHANDRMEEITQKAHSLLAWVSCLSPEDDAMTLALAKQLHTDAETGETDWDALHPRAQGRYVAVAKRALGAIGRVSVTYGAPIEPLS